MLTTGFSVQGASLRLLRSHEQGVITHIHALRDATAETLREMGLTLGKSITVEQRFPRFIVRVGGHRYSLDKTVINAIYVRIIKH